MLHDASDVVDVVILLQLVAVRENFWFVSNYLTHLLTKILFLPNNIDYACLLYKTIY